MNNQEKKEYWICRYFGHKWSPVYINKKTQWRFISVTCDRWQCMFGEREILDFVLKNTPIINTRSKNYFYD